MTNQANLTWILISISLTLIIGLGQAKAANPQTILNVSYDPTREFYEDYNVLDSAKFFELS